MTSSLSDTEDFRQLFLSNTKLLDVRSPVEFQRGAFPGAVNMPLMSDQERHEVGLCYKRAGQTKAIELGHELVSGELRAARIKLWKEHAERHPSGYLYCFRGGLRSRTVQTWLAECGIQYPLVVGGYKAMRQYLIKSLESAVSRLNFIIIAGRTGSGKTLLLRQMQHYTDLEGLAKHRGSSFGALDVEQPSNIDFENAISIDMLRHLHAAHETVYLEDEGRMIGRACVPEALRNRMSQLPMVVLDASLEYRIDISLDAYVVQLLQMYQQRFDPAVGFDAFVQHHKNGLARIVKRFGGDNYKKTMALLEHAVEQHKSKQCLDGYRGYISKLLCEYYDPMYDYQIQKKQHRVVFKGSESEILAWSQQTMTAS